jgi:hypothetical protein
VSFLLGSRGIPPWAHTPRTFSALTDNNEASVLIRSKEVAKDLGDYFNKVKATGSKK